MERIDAQFDMALERLLNGESLEALAHEYPAYAEELASYAPILGAAATVASMRPDPERLRTALSSMRVADLKPASEEGSFVRISSFFMTYRTALVLPVLVVMLVATGAVALPFVDRSDVVLGPGGEPQGGDAAVPQQESQRISMVAPAEDTATTGFAAPSTMMMKSQSNPAPTETMPQDQDMASVFGDEIRRDTQDAAVAQNEAAQSADDTSELAQYEHAYDEQDL